MWTKRNDLAAELQFQQVPEARQAKQADYMRLLKEGKSWWGLIRLFKISQFPDGFKLSVDKTFGPLGSDTGHPGSEASPNHITAGNFSKGQGMVTGKVSTQAHP
jgi:hypothetical protein